MDTTQVWTNIIAYVLQIGLLVGIGAALPALLRLSGGGKAPAARLLYWQVLLVACLALPWMRAWRSEVIVMANAPIVAVKMAEHVGMNAAVRPVFPPVTSIALWLLLAGVALRLLWLATGLLKLAGYRRHGQAIPLPAEWSNSARDTRLLLSDQISGPVTFGFFRPVVLLPANFPTMSDAMRDAILFHELLHVERRDWLFTLGEEIVRAVFWFHPAIWWVLGEIQLSREQTVDQAVIDMTQARGPYVDTLLAMAGVTAELDLAPAPLFLRRRHLKQRVMGIVREARMSKKRLVMGQVAALCTMAVACWFITSVVPLHAQAQMMVDGPGVSVNMNGSQLMHRTPVSYPVDALMKGVEGTVVVQVRLDANGEVIDDAILSGPDDLRKGVQQAVLNWHFDKSAGGATRVVNIDFVKPVGANSPVPASVQAQVPIAPARPAPGGRGGAGPTPAVVQQSNPALENFMLNQLSELKKKQADGSDPAGTALLNEMQKKLQELAAAQQMQSRKFGNIVVAGLSDSTRDQLIAQIPFRPGDPWSYELAVKSIEVAKAFDSHLAASFATMGNNTSELRITAPQTVIASGAPGQMMGSLIPAATQFSGNATNGPQRIGGNVQAANLLSAVKPVYPPLAKMARQQGTVKFEATIAKEGYIEDLKVISGPPLLIPAALEAVKQWQYKPTLLNGNAVEVLTTIDVNFTLSDGGPSPAAQ